MVGTKCRDVPQGDFERSELSCVSFRAPKLGCLLTSFLRNWRPVNERRCHHYLCTYPWMLPFARSLPLCHWNPQLMKRETEIRMNVSPIAGIRSTHLQVDSRNHHRQLRRRMSELLMREAVDLHPSHPEIGSVGQSLLLRLVVSLDQENLPPEPGRKNYARHRSCHPALFGNQAAQQRYRQAFPGGWAVEGAWAIFRALFF